MCGDFRGVWQVLADGVAHASKHLSPDLILDMATLTGAQVTPPQFAQVTPPSPAGCSAWRRRAAGWLGAAAHGARLAEAAGLVCSPRAKVAGKGHL